MGSHIREQVVQLPDNSTKGHPARLRCFMNHMILEGLKFLPHSFLSLKTSLAIS